MFNLLSGQVTKKLGTDFKQTLAPVHTNLKNPNITFLSVSPTVLKCSKYDCLQGNILTSNSHAQTKLENQTSHSHVGGLRIQHTLRDKRRLTS